MHGFSLAGDIANPAPGARWMAGVAKTFGTPDMLIDNAGFIIRKDVLKPSATEFDSVIATNLRGMFLLRPSGRPLDEEACGEAAPFQARQRTASGRQCPGRHRQSLPVPG